MLGSTEKNKEKGKKIKTRDEIVIIDAENDECSILKEEFLKEYNVMTASNCLEAADQVREEKDMIAAFIIESVHENREIYWFLEQLNSWNLLGTVPVYLLVSEISIEQMGDFNDMGVTDIICRPIFPGFIRRRVSGGIEVFFNKKRLEGSNYPFFDVQNSEKTVNDGFYSFLSSIPGGIFRYKADETEQIDYISQGLLDLYGCTEEEFRAGSGNSFRGMVYPEDIERVEKEIGLQISEGNEDQVTYRIMRKDGKIRWVEDCGRLVTDSFGEKWFYVVLLDITDKIHYQQELEKGNMRQQMLADLSNNIFFDIDYSSGNIDVFGDFEERFGRKPQLNDFIMISRFREAERIRDKRLQIRCHQSLKLLERQEEVDIVLKDKDDQPVWCRYQSAVMQNKENEEVLHYIGRLLDINEFVIERQEQLKRAEYDSLTGVLNRSAAIGRIKTCLYDEKHVQRNIFILLDIDNFKSINDTYGHPRGDEVLKSLACRLKTQFRDQDIIGRLGGDEFILFLTEVGNLEKIEKRLQEICRTILNGCRIDNIKVESLTCSMGGVYCDRSDVSISELYEKSDKALYEAKRRGKSQFCMYHEYFEE